LAIIRGLWLCVLLSGLIVFISAPVCAQVAGGTLSGTVTDSGGGGIPDAQVTISNIFTGIERQVATNGDGFYTAPNLLPGDYQITITAKGFNAQTKTGLNVNVGAHQTLDVVMQVGTVAGSIEVIAEVPAVQLASSEISATVNATTVRELPLNGRSWTDLAALQPGVSTIGTQPSFTTGADRGNRGFGQQLTISGARPQQNNYRLDGVSLNDYANGAPGSVLGGNLGVDAIQEFSVLTSNYSAEYGKTSGGVVNAITRSGTNSFHGSGYEFLRNGALDAANFFENAGSIPKAPFKRNQFGGTIGGPIVKNRTFFFADYEGIRQSKGIADKSFVPSSEARNGNLHDPATGQPFTVAVDPASQKYLALYPVPASCGADVCSFTYSANQVVNENFVTTRVDHKFSDKDGVFGTYLFDKTPYSSPDAFGNVQLGTSSSRQIVAVEESHTFTPAFVNAIRFGYNHEVVVLNSTVNPINPAAADSSLGAFPGRNAASVNVNGISSLPGGLGGFPSNIYHWNSFQLYDDAFWNRGTHSIKFGFAFERMALQITALVDANGVWFFDSLQKFLQNNPTKFQGGIASSLTPRDMRQNLVGGYLQDDWRWKPNFTVNLGLRYEMSTVPTEINGKFVNLRNITDAVAHLGDPLFHNPTTKDFEPRIGFAWDVFRNGRLAVRGGIGLYDVQPLLYQFTLLQTQATPFQQYTVLKAADPTLKVPLTFPLVPQQDITPNKFQSTYINSDPKRTYVGQWNLNLQYQLTPSLVAMVAYVGSRGVHQPFRVDDSNLVLPTKTSAGYLWPQVDMNGNQLNGPNAGSPPNPINPNFGSVRGLFYNGRSYYNALETQLAKRMSHGFQVQGAFTWSKSIDTSSASIAGDAFGTSISSLNYFDLKLTRGLSDFNVGRTLVINGTWEVPSTASWKGTAKWLADGWQLGLIFTASDGSPFTPTWGTGGDPAGTLSSDDYAFPNRLTGPGCHTLTNPGNPNNYIKTQCFTIPTAPNDAFWNAYCDPAPPSLGVPIRGDKTHPPVANLSPLACFNLRGNSGRNILIGPGTTNLDFSVFKNNHIKRISETFNVQFRAEIFNILNHANFAPPGPGDFNTDIFTAGATSLAPNVVAGGTAGVLVKTTIPERQIQFALKVIF
jgi:hypothetical protein